MIAPGSLMRSGLILLAMIVLTIAGPVRGAAARTQAPCRVPDTPGPVMRKRAGFFPHLIPGTSPTTKGTVPLQGRGT